MENGRNSKKSNLSEKLQTTPQDTLRTGRLIFNNTITVN